MKRDELFHVLIIKHQLTSQPASLPPSLKIIVLRKTGFPKAVNTENESRLLVND